MAPTGVRSARARARALPTAVALLLCASPLARATPEVGVNVRPGGTTPCTNSIDGEPTSATSDGNGNIVVGCARCCARGVLLAQPLVPILGPRGVPPRQVGMWA